MNSKTKKGISIFMLVLMITLSFPMDTFAAANGTGRYRITAQQGVNIRRSASVTSARLGVVPYNTVVSVSLITGVWGKITYAGVTGYISLDYATKVSTTVTQSQTRKIIDWAESKAKAADRSYNGWCQKFVGDAYRSVGLNYSAASAIDAWNKWGIAGSKNTTPPIGACVYFTYGQYGHVGIYVGNGNVIHAVSTVKKESLSTMKNYSYYTYLGWGYQGGRKPN